MMPLALVIGLLVLVNVWVHVGPRRTHVVTGPVAALVLLLIARAAGLSWADLGLSPADAGAGLRYGAAAAALVAAGYVVASAVPLTRRAFLDDRYRMPVRSAARLALVTIPLATVVFEEVAFRSVLWGLLERTEGATVATVVTAVLFGLWHVLPALDLVRSSTTLRTREGPVGLRRTVLTVVGTVVFTTLAGIVFGELRRASGSLLAPVVLHWSANGLAVVAAARAWSAQGSLAPDEVSPPVRTQGGTSVPDRRRSPP